MEVTGQLKLKGDIQKVSEKFQKRDFVLSTDLSTPYPQHVSFQITQDKCSLIDQFNEGDELKVQFETEILEKIQVIIKKLGQGLKLNKTKSKSNMITNYNKY